MIARGQKLSFEWGTFSSRCQSPFSGSNRLSHNVFHLSSQTDSALPNAAETEALGPRAAARRILIPKAHKRHCHTFPKGLKNNKSGPSCYDCHNWIPVSDLSSASAWQELPTSVASSAVCCRRYCSGDYSTRLRTSGLDRFCMKINRGWWKWLPSPIPHPKARKQLRDL